MSSATQTLVPPFRRPFVIFCVFFSVTAYTPLDTLSKPLPEIATPPMFAVKTMRA